MASPRRLLGALAGGLARLQAATGEVGVLRVFDGREALVLAG